MKEFLKKQIPLWLVVVSMLAFSFVYQVCQPKPDWEEFTIFLVAQDRYLDNPSDNRLADLLEANLREMEALYVGIYGAIPGPIYGELERLKEKLSKKLRGGDTQDGNKKE